MRGRFLMAILCCAVSAQLGVFAATPAVSLGEHHSVALARDGTVLTWGDDHAGQLGLGRRIKSATPLALGTLAGATSLSAADGYSVAIAADGTPWGWGAALAFGDGIGTDRPTPERIAVLPTMQAISGRKYHAVGLAADGTVWAWGANGFGQVGNGNTTTQDKPVQVPGLTGITAVSVGLYHSVALRGDGTVFTWGYNHNGQIGNDTTNDRLTPASVPGLAGVTRISAAGSFTLALKSDGSVWAWGYNHYGQLGDGTFTDRGSPTQVLGLPGRATEISAGDSYALALMENGTVWSWGSTASGFQLGDGSGVDRATPGPVSNLTDVDAIAAGDAFSLAKKRDGTLWAWGHNLTGHLGDGTFVDRSTPVQVAISGVDLISAGQGMESHALVRKSDGSLWTWGSNVSGQLGDGTPLVRSTPTRVPGLNGITAIAAGDYHTLARAADGTVWAWGLNEAGQLGDNTSFGRSTPGLVPGLSGVDAIAAGGGHNLARLGNGTLVAWGDNCCGQLGRGNDSDIGFAVLTGVRDFSAGYTHSVAVKNDGTVWAWGSNGSGELGDGTLIGRFEPTPVPGLANVAKVSAGSSYTPYTLALKSDGTVWAWGDNSLSQLGDGTSASRLNPVQVSGLGNVMSISAGGAYALAMKSDGSVWGWGANESGQLGDGTTDLRASPVRVSAISSATAIGASRAPYFNNSAAVMSDGTLWGWGSYHSGQMGDGALAQRVLPVVVVSEGGAGSIAGNDWFLDLDPARTKQIPPDKIPALLTVATGNTGGAVSDVDASVKFRAQDIGNPIYVFGYVPAARVKNASRALAKNASGAKDGGDCVLAQLTTSGVPQQVSASNLQGYVSNVTSTQGQAITVLNSVATASVAGSTFCVGTATTSGQAVSASNSTCVATVPLTATGGPICLPPNNLSVSANSPGALSGLWWNSGESGWGIDFTQRRNVIFAAWYTYDANGNPKWYVASNCAMPAAGVTTGTCNGTLYEVNGPTFFGTAFNPNAVNVVTAGTLSVNFTNASSASMTYTVGSQTRTVNITRQAFASGATPGVDYTDLWWNPSESGWGMAIAQQASVMFLAWYVYDGSGKPMWYVASNCAVSGNGCSGTLYRTTGPAFGPTFDPGSIQVFTVGGVSLTFSDADHGTLSYTVDGVSGTKSITRQLF